MTTKWYDSHANLYKLAEWLRQNNGWNWFKDNAFEMLETPWSYEKEWRLANGDVHFVEIHHDEAHDLAVDNATCAWCDAAVGYNTYEDDDGHGHVEWSTTYHDDNTGDLACDDCAGTAVNFAETTNLRATQTMHNVSVVAGVGGSHRATCSCGWASRQTWENRELAQADGNGHFIFAEPVQP